MTTRPIPLPPRQRGMALVLVLALIVLLTVVVVAFFAQATSNRLIETSRANRTQAELLARSAGDYVVGNFLAEVRDPTRSDTNTPAVFLPLASSNALPARRVSPAIPAAETNFFNLVRQSVTGADSNASAHGSATAARNGRFVGSSRWNLPHLLAGGFQNADQLPQWIYLTSDGGLTNSPSPKVIGRFAYNVYDIGGLLNANTAGFPGLANPGEIAILKGFPAGADLTALGLAQADVDALVAFRNPQSAHSATAYSSNVAWSARDGFLSLVPSGSNPVQTNNYFHSRQDLLRYALTRNTALTNALPYLTHFSQSLSAPSFIPATPTAANPVFPTLSFRNAGTVLHYHDDGTTETYAVAAGDPLMPRRFSLARLAWLTPTGPAPGISATAIRAVFGLEWNGAQDRWDFVGSDGSTNAIAVIPTLAEVADRNREPNFFELLKAGIAEGSVGQAAGQKTMAGVTNQALEADKDFHILRIGACMVDQADADNYPTILSLADDLEAAGVEDLPYVHQMAMIALRQTDTTQTPNKLTHADMIWAPVFFNPHRASAPVGGPSEVVMDVARGTLTRVMASSGSELVQALTKDLSVLPAITVPSADWEAFRTTPGPARNATAATRLGSLISYASGDTDVNALNLFSYQNEYTGTWPADRPVSDNAIFRVNVDDLIIRLRYRNAQGNLKTYATIAGHEAVPGSGWNGIAHPTQGMVTGFGPSFLTPARLQQSDLSLSYYAALWDPRTNRLGPSYGQTRHVADPPAVSGTADRIRSNTPFAYTDNAAQPVFPALWPEGARGNEGPGFHSNFADPDGQFRPADGWLGPDANLYRNLADIARRPVILQRPFRTVAELGYAFRDSPWKTVNFFDETSGDGALLDLFSVVDEPRITAGRIHLHSRQAPVLQALLSEAGQMPDGSSPLADPQAVAAGYQTRGFAAGQPTAQLPVNTAGLPAFLSSPELPSGMPLHKARREAVVRALGSGTQTRTWNLLVDLVAQSGKFRGGLTEKDFVVEGEKRYWLSLAMDRITAEIIAEQWEAVNE